MAEIKDFQALRFTAKAGELGSALCPPYDIISENKRLEYIKNNPYNIIRLELPKDNGAYESPYQNAGAVLKNWLASEILKRDEVSALYIYEIEFVIDERHDLSGVTPGKRSIVGLVGLLKLEEFEKGVVIPHEETLSKAKEDRFKLMDATHCNFSNIYTLYKNPEKNDALHLEAYTKGKTPLSEVMDEEGLIHRIWAVEDKSVIEEIKKALKDKAFYIADGHHRYETALNFRNHMMKAEQVDENSGYGYIMNMMVDMGHEGLVVFPTHRLIHSLENFNEAELIAKCEDFFEIEKDILLEKLNSVLEEGYLRGAHSFALYSGNDKFTLLTLKDEDIMQKYLPDKSLASRKLDVTILHTLILEKLLGIDKENLANQTNLTYTRSLKEALAEVEKGNYQCAFILNPTRVSEISDVAGEGEKMPQKSTYFYPKLITGLTMNKLD